MQVSLKRSGGARTGMIVAGGAALVLVAGLFVKIRLSVGGDAGFLTNFKTLFISIILEALPFMLLGVLFSAILQVFVSESTVRRLIPRNPVLAVLFACVLGFIFPICECGLTPVVRRLMRKGMPLHVAVVFIVAGPIVNPIVFAATYTAFRTHPAIAYSRLGMAFVIACIIGLFVWRLVKTDQLRETAESVPHVHEHAHSHDSHDHNHDHQDDHQHVHARPRGGRIGEAMSHASDEFFEMGKYLLLGSLITALIQTLVARESLVAMGHGQWSSHLFMMGFAYVLSLCSTSDAFVASSFATLFSTGSLLTFLVFGPMLDLKGTIMLFSVFKRKFVLLLSALIVVTVLAVSIVAEQILPL